MQLLLGRTSFIVILADGGGGGYVLGIHNGMRNAVLAMLHIWGKKNREMGRILSLSIVPG